ncbi:MAG: methyltransferase domain-containing protein, partial [Anaerolineae bacterium]|nr:methyltransferase domain-containing protein [Anaerolineae bacterium]
MDFAAYYDAYWREKGDTVDRRRLAFVARYISSGERVLQVDCGPGVLAEMLGARGARVWGTDLSLVAARRAYRRGIPVCNVDLDRGALPFPDGTFDTVLSDSQVEHRVRFEHVFDELVRVLRPGGKLILFLPNIAHWRFRLWLLRGRFPYLENSPTDWLHLRFFTVAEVQALLKARGVTVEKLDGYASLWVPGLYPGWVRWRGIY